MTAIPIFQTAPRRGRLTNRSFCRTVCLQRIMCGAAVPGGCPAGSRSYDRQERQAVRLPLPRKVSCPLPIDEIDQQSKYTHALPPGKAAYKRSDFIPLGCRRYETPGRFSFRKERDASNQAFSNQSALRRLTDSGYAGAARRHTNAQAFYLAALRFPHAKFDNLSFFKPALARVL